MYGDIVTDARFNELALFSHHPSSLQSVRALDLLRRAVSSPYPPSKPDAPPLDFDLEVVDSQPPNTDQIRTIIQYLPRRSSDAQQDASALLSAHPSGGGVYADAEDVLAAVRQSSSALRWPIVVDWMGGRACAGDVDCVKGILEALRKERDGE
jgi:hypothetical protein